MTVSKIVYNPELDVLGELIPVYTREYGSTLENIDGYAITLTYDEPVGYLVFVNEYENGEFFNREAVERTLDAGIIVEI